MATFKAELTDIVHQNLDQGVLARLLDQLRLLDQELDQKMQDVREAQQNVTVWDRVNIFTRSEAEQILKEENRLYTQIRKEHGDVVKEIKALIREAIFCDLGLSLKIQTGEIQKAASRLRIEHKWAQHKTRMHGYHIGGMQQLLAEVSRLDGIINSAYQFPVGVVNVDELLHVVYDEILLRGGFIQ